jgi:limonene-1,2-epoxide hydrolase
MGTGVPPAQYGPQPPKKSPLPWIIGILGVLVVAAVVLVLVFVVFKGDDNGGAVDASGPEKVVETFFKALERQDAKMLVSTMEPAFVDELKSILGSDYIQLLDEYFFEYFPEDLKITIRKMESDIKGDKAEVTVIDGTMAWTDEYGDKITEEAADADMDAFELVKVDGKWYLSEDTLIDMGFDLSGLSDLEDMSFDDEFSDEDYGWEVTLPIDSEDEALTVAFEDPYIWDWYMATDGAFFEVTEENESYILYFYEIGPDETDIPFGWFAVDKKTGELYEVTND